MTKQGRLAGSSGSTLEKVAISTLQSKGFEVVMYREWTKHPERYGNELLLKNVPYTTIYKHQGHTEFLLQSEKHKIEIRIECKWQQSGGSVDEKFPYLYLNCIERMPEQNIIIILDGAGAKAGGVQWLKDACANKPYTNTTTASKSITVMDLAGFVTWANKTFR